MLPGCSQQQGVIDHVRLQPPLCRIASSTRGRPASFDPISYFANTRLCRDWPGRHSRLPAAGTEVAFERDVECDGLFGFFRGRSLKQKLARFRQINLDQPTMHHDALEFPDGEIVLVTQLREGQHATVLQLPALEQAPCEAVTIERVPVSTMA